MSEADDDVLGKLDALLKRHQAPPEPEIPVLTEVVVPSPLDLDAIPLLTEEVPPHELGAATGSREGGTEVPPLPELLPDAVRETSTAPSLPILEFDLPPNARWISLAESEVPQPAPVATETSPTDIAGEPAAPAAKAIAPVPAGSEAAQPPTAPAPSALSQETIQLIADIIKADVAKILDQQLTQALAQQLQTSLHLALDRALSSMLDQFMIHMEEVVKVAIASELEKQLEALRKPLP
ncbi:hypothetical protein [Thiobacter aerophilum]|uniref:DUF2486 family protein n=1 Tax=Thiobacter aerophilum TaxID=3121275 RepID=A0ABV0EHI2_9BURK